MRERVGDPRQTAALRPVSLLQRKCACDGSTRDGIECSDCRNRRHPLQRSSQDEPAHTVVPPIVHDVLRSGGQPLDAATRAFLEPRLGFDFSHVRVHTDGKAAESARAVQALAYTVGRDVVFAARQYAPHTSQGRKVIAHELAHVMQQATSIGQASSPSGERTEAEAEELAHQVSGRASLQVDTTAPAGTMQRQRDKNPLSEEAKSIIATAKDENVPLEKRAVALVNAIVSTYYPGASPKVASVEFNDEEAGTGLKTQSVGAGASAKGKIYVSTYFIKNVDAFARRVLQVEHELMHIDQYRGGLAGGQNKDKREFLAFHAEALAKEKQGTGRMSYATWLALVDAALGYYNCLAEADQTSFAEKKKHLLERRAEVNGKAGNEPVPEPTACKRQ